MTAAATHDTRHVRRSVRHPEKRRRPVTPRHPRGADQRSLSVSVPANVSTTQRRQVAHSMEVDAVVGRRPQLRSAVRPSTLVGVESANHTTAIVPTVREAGGAPMRLTRRGRLVVFLTLVAATLATVTLVGGPALSSDQAHHSVSRTVVVASGETLWDIAKRVAPAEDPRAVVDDIVALNHLRDGGVIRTGQPLEVPAY
ncbi:MAG: hypothetical protein AVDCRST_MAG21-1447 [uncultured Nocardioidaceae bacterium]|uniref:LysM domain-containing protein n=1 Tax=uncultured Nocardioidaceae bacterium TaxID=253824 RepID=A0A6J4N738_9ACTN|nr:MAG: hypothetical protein AVDCRST_MAG21-1447 [uncultured Nocardioidaceae bacterium]